MASERFRKQLLARLGYHPTLPLVVVAHRMLPDREPAYPAREIRRIYLDLLWKLSTRRERLEIALRSVRSIGLLARLIVVRTRKNGAWAKQVSGKGVVRQAAEQLALTLRLGILPRSYYVYELHRREESTRARHYLEANMFTKWGVPYVLQHYLDARGPECLDEKVRFSEICRAGGLPTAPTLLWVEKGEVMHCDRDALVRAAALFVKPTDGSCGKGTCKLVRGDDGHFVSNTGERVRPDDLCEWLKDRYAGDGTDFLVQTCLTNHSQLADLCTNALSTLRIVTVTNEEGEAEPVIAALRIGVGTAIVDNMHSGGLISPVDVGTGAIGRATRTRGWTTAHTRGWTESHPDTGIRIEGRRVPLWPEVLELVLAAHRHFGKALVGWDVAVTPEGPVLVEGNSHPTLDTQRPHRTPLGLTRFGEVVAHHLKRIEDEALTFDENRTPRPRCECDVPSAL